MPIPPRKPYHKYSSPSELAVPVNRYAAPYRTPAIVATRRGPYLSWSRPPMIVPTQRKKIASVNVSVTWVCEQPYYLSYGLVDPLQPYTASKHTRMKLAAITINQRLGRLFASFLLDNA